MSRCVGPDECVRRGQTANVEDTAAPRDFAELLASVLLMTVSVPTFRMPPPNAAELPAIVLLVTVSRAVA